MLCELIGSRLATYFGISVPEPALVIIDSEFADLIASEYQSDSEKASHIQGSVGLNFGSRQLSSVSTWPVDKSVPESMWQCATEVFAFDALIQNPDRRFDNPNLFAKGDDFLLFDHELAFSFLLDILQSTTPWHLITQKYLNQHVFFRVLKAKPINLARFENQLARLKGSALDRVLEDVPPEWNNGSLPSIQSHLRTLGVHATEFVQEVRRTIA